MGGASRADAVGQIVVRAAAWLSLVAVALFAPRPALGDARSVLLLLLGVIALVAVQIVPLPPAIWMALPGRAAFREAAMLAGQPQPWRPWSIVPDATINALSALIVPVATLVLVAGSTATERARLPGVLLVLVTASMLIGVLQFSGSGIDNPFVNDTPGQVNGLLANRNHFALLLAIGCVLAPVWAVLDGRRPGWRGPLAAALVLLFLLTLLATGSRAGLLLGMLALIASLFFIRRALTRELRRYPRWVLPTVVAGVTITFAIVLLLSLFADRAVSVGRVFTLDQGQDMRVRGLPVVWDMVMTYFPAGTGAGSFDPLFRLHEPLALLKPTYFNHAHNDFLEIALDTGGIGVLLLVAAIAWWAIASVRALRLPGRSGPGADMIGSAILLLVLIASAFDYPARTPVIMAVIVLAATWLDPAAKRSTLPSENQHL